MRAVVETYAELAREILGRPARLGGTRLVAVDGPSGAGKSVFAGRLAGAVAGVLRAAAVQAEPSALRATAGRESPPGTGGAPETDLAVPVVHTDDLLDGWADQFTFWPRLDRWVLSPLRAGRPGRYRRYDWVGKRFTTPWVPVPPAPVVILEGVSTARAEIRPELTLAVFVAAPSPLRRERALARDGVALLPYLDEWRRAERAHFAADATAQHVDVVVDGAPAIPHDPEAGYARLRRRTGPSGAFT